MVTEGDVAPDFTLPSDTEGDLELADLLARSKFTVLYFYPRDNTPGCTTEAQAFRDAMSELRAAGAQVVGVSKDSIGSHAGFRAKHGINFPLLSDGDLAVHKAYGAFGEKMMYGKKTLGTIRSTFVLGPSGEVMRVFRGVRVPGHLDAVLAVLRGDQAPVTSSKKSAAKRKK